MKIGYKELITRPDITNAVTDVTRPQMLTVIVILFVILWTAIDIVRTVIVIIRRDTTSAVDCCSPMDVVPIWRTTLVTLLCTRLQGDLWCNGESIDGVGDTKSVTKCGRFCLLDLVLVLFLWRVKMVVKLLLMWWMMMVMSPTQLVHICWQGALAKSRTI